MLGEKRSGGTIVSIVSTDAAFSYRLIRGLPRDVAAGGVMLAKIAQVGHGVAARETLDVLGLRIVGTEQPPAPATLAVRFPFVLGRRVDRKGPLRHLREKGSRRPAQAACDDPRAGAAPRGNVLRSG